MNAGNKAIDIFLYAIQELMKKVWACELDLLNLLLKLHFEDIMIPIPRDYDKILKIDFGDYMTPVQAPTMHGSLLFDTERSYKEILKGIDN